MNPNTTNKGGISPIPSKTYLISGSDVANYLMNQLGFNIAYDFTRWTGAQPDDSYVRMRVVMSPKDIVANQKPTDFVDKVLQANAAGIQFKDTVINTLKPFVYPDTIANVINNPETLNRLARNGIFGDRLAEIIQNSKLNYCKEFDMFNLYLRPERIIADMLVDVTTGEIPGEMSIIATYGVTSETIRWVVDVNEQTSAIATGVDIDRIFTNR